jgi:hypothetical protein
MLKVKKRVYYSKQNVSFWARNGML